MASGLTEGSTPAFIGPVSPPTTEDPIATSDPITPLPNTSASAGRDVSHVNEVMDTSTIKARIPFKPAPDFYDNTGLHSAVVNFNPPRRSQCARVPDQFHLHFEFQNIAYQGRKYDQETWSYSRSRGSPDLEAVGGRRCPYVVFGIFPRGETRPSERLVVIRSEKHLLWRLRWNLICLRGFRFLFSLKGIKGLGLYEVSQPYTLIGYN